MTAKEYADKYFGSVVYFDVVEQDKSEYAKVFAQGSSALEALLLHLWSKGVKTFACGNDHVLIGPEADRLDFERRIQKKFDDYMHSRGVRRFFKDLHRDDFMSFHGAYVLIDSGSLPGVAQFVESLKSAMAPLYSECTFSVAKPKIRSLGNAQCLGLYFKVSREGELKGRVLADMSDDEIIRSSLPPADLFDKYFEIVNQVFEEHFQRYNVRVGPLEDVEDVDLVSFSRGGELPESERFENSDFSKSEHPSGRSVDDILLDASKRSLETKADAEFKGKAFVEKEL